MTCDLIPSFLWLSTQNSHTFFTMLCPQFAEKVMSCKKCFPLRGLWAEIGILFLSLPLKHSQLLKSELVAMLRKRIGVIMYQTSKSKGQELVAQRMVREFIKMGHEAYLITSISKITPSPWVMFLMAMSCLSVFFRTRKVFLRWGYLSMSSSFIPVLCCSSCSFLTNVMTSPSLRGRYTGFAPNTCKLKPVLASYTKAPTPMMEGTRATSKRNIWGETNAEIDWVAKVHKFCAAEINVSLRISCHKGCNKITKAGEKPAIKNLHG